MKRHRSAIAAVLAFTLWSQAGLWSFAAAPSEKPTPGELLQAER